MSSSVSELTTMATAGNGADNKSYCSKRGRICCALTLFAVLAVSLLVCVLTPWLYSSVIQPEIKELIDENVLLTNGSVGLEQFISSKAPLYSEYRLFTVLNAEDVTNKAAKPQLKEIGPFVYRENRTKIDLVWEDEGNVLKFSQLINYTYNEVLSYGLDPHTTKVTTVNLPLMGVLQKIEAYQEESKTDKFIMEVVDYVVKHLLPSESLFVTKTVHELLWGYQDSLLTDIMKAQQIVHKKLVNSDRFGLGELNSIEAPNRVYTGKDNVTLVGSYKQWNGNYNISGWGTAEARAIRGTGGFLFHPGLSREENLTMFISELFRSGYFSYQHDTDVYGITLYNYGLPKDELLNSTQDPGFYPNGPSGVLNLTAVMEAHVPMFVSKPHFLDADPGYLHNVSGLNPQRSIHDSYVGVEPITGAVLDAAKRIQLNLRLARHSSLSHLSAVRPLTMIPVYWVAQGGKIPENLASTFKSTVYGVEEGVSAGTFALIGLSGLVVVICVLGLGALAVGAWHRRNHQRHRIINVNETSPLLNTDINA